MYSKMTYSHGQIGLIVSSISAFVTLIVAFKKHLKKCECLCFKMEQVDRIDVERQEQQNMTLALQLLCTVVDSKIKKSQENVLPLYTAEPKKVSLQPVSEEHVKELNEMINMAVSSYSESEEKNGTPNKSKKISMKKRKQSLEEDDKQQPDLLSSLPV